MTNIHASCVMLARKGVLLLGDSGAGKSDLALRLIDAGGRLVADDRADLVARNGRLWARAPAAIAGKIEIRGLGIVDLPHAAGAAVALAVRLGEMPARLPEPEFFAPLKGAAAVPLLRLHGREASAVAKIRLFLCQPGAVAGAGNKASPKGAV